MRFNQFSYLPTGTEEALTQLQELGFQLDPQQTSKDTLKHFLQRIYFLTPNHDHVFSNLIADWETDLLTFFQSDRELDDHVFYQVALQVLGFVPHFDYQDVSAFVAASGFPIVYGAIIDNLYQLLATRTKSGNTLIDQLVSDNLIPEDNRYHFFNGKSLATFSTKNLIREVVYVETSVDTAQSGQPDLVKVSILRPHFDGRIPAVITNSPYHQGINEIASDQALHKMETELRVKPAGTIQVTEPARPQVAQTTIDQPISPATETLGHIGSYSLNDYLLPRGFASLHVSGPGTLGSTGLMTSGDYQQIDGFKAVIDWLNGRAKAYTDHSRRLEVRAEWASGKVVTTGLSYLGTMSNGLATTGVDGLEVIIAEAGISSWYDYYRENGLVTSPGGYPGEDLDSLTALTYSKSLQAGDFLRNRASYQAAFEAEGKALDRESGDYNQYWQNRNYLLQADKVRCQVVFTHGSQDWNVKPIHVWNMFHALPASVEKHLFFHHGAHVYMNNWQSIDFRESMNALLSQRLLGQDTGYTLPTVIWQDNQAEQTWKSLDTFGAGKQLSLPLGSDLVTIDNHYEEETFTRYAASYTAFHQDLFEGKAQQACLDFTLPADIQLNGRVRLRLRVKSSTNKGLLSAHLLDLGSAKRHSPIPELKARASLDNGRFHAQEHLMELPFTESPHRLITKGFLNLQNRTDLLTIETVLPDQWMDFQWDLQPTIYTLKAGSHIRLLLHTTDFECTVRDNGQWQLTLDCEHSHMDIPHSS